MNQFCVSNQEGVSTASWRTKKVSMRTLLGRRALRYLFATLFIFGILFIIKGSYSRPSADMKTTTSSTTPTPVLHMKEDAKEFQKIDKPKKVNNFVVKDKPIGPEKPVGPAKDGNIQPQPNPRIRGKLPPVQPIPSSKLRKDKTKITNRKEVQDPLETAIEYMTTYDSKTTPIPKLIHQMYGTHRLPKALDELVVKLRKQENYTHLLWSDYDLDQFVQRFHPSVYALYRTLPIPHMRSDLTRYLLLYSFGGTFCDIEVDLIMDLDNWTDGKRIGLLVGIESVGSTKSNWGNTEREVRFGQFVLSAVPGHEVLAKALYMSQQRIKNAQQITMNDLEYMTGGILWTDALAEVLSSKGKSLRTLKDLTEPELVDDVYILPKNAFAGDKSSLNGMTRAIRQVGSRPFL
jgi:mannosyltransferase OCH1-like enzyme